MCSYRRPESLGGLTGTLKKSDDGSIDCLDDSGCVDFSCKRVDLLAGVSDVTESAPLKYRKN